MMNRPDSVNIDVIHLKSMARTSSIIAFSLIVVAATWAIAAARVCWFAGDYMIGFSPFILLGFPFAASCLGIGGIVAATRKSKLLGACAILACLLSVSPLFCMQQISKAAWNNSLQRFADTNETAIQQTDFTSADFTAGDFPDERRMTDVLGFEWYCEQHIAAPNGQFRGFTYNTIPHVYVSKIRHGFRGVAWISDTATIPSESDYRYQESTVKNWYIWTYGG